MAFIETPRLFFRELTLADLDFVAAFRSHPEVMRYYPRCYSRAESEDWIRRQLDRYAQFGHGLWLVLEKATGQPVGTIGLVPQTVEGVAETEIGYLVHRPFWLRGIATEGAAACRDYAFEVLRRPRVIALIRPENVPSQGVARKIGMTPLPHTVMHIGYVHQIFALERPEKAQLPGTIQNG
jgi:RimJ/RimL family protein N-acetyltransferase